MIKKVVVDGDELTVYGGGAWLVDEHGKKWSSAEEYRYFKARRPQLPTVTKQSGPVNETVEEHPAFGLIKASHVTGKAKLFGSDFSHAGFVQIEISRARMYRGLSSDRPHPTHELIQVDLSEAQWATFISTLNQGVGVPCTIDSLRGEGPIPRVAIREQKREVFKAEASEDLVASEQKIDEALALIRAGKLRKGELESLLVQAKNRMTGGVDFVAKSFGEHVETTVEHAKIEVEAYVQGVLQRAGAKALVDGGQFPVVLPERGSRAMMLGDLVPALRTLGRPCWRKEKHLSQGAAEAHLRHLRTVGLLRDERTANTYQCSHCGTWHVGHSSREQGAR